jgi:endonuclease/exonuclease/phosphatase family metal-dependent hydrolase
MRKSRIELRIATYNIHKCRGLDRRVLPERIADVLAEVDADVVALQEVVRFDSGLRSEDQARFLADELGYDIAFGQTRFHSGGRYGNVVLTRFPIRDHSNYDISVRGREARGCLRTDIQLGPETLHVFNVHFGTALTEHRRQARLLFDRRIVSRDHLTGHRIVLGDFNQWLPGTVSKTLTRHLEFADIRSHLQRSRTYPGIFPLFNLDHIYYDRSVRLERLRLFRNRTSLVASDHLPLVADISLRPAAESLH